MEYLDFEVEVSPAAAGGHAVRVFRSPAGQATGTLRLGMDESALAAAVDSLQAALLGGDGGEAKAVLELGQALWDALFTGEVLACFEISRRLAREEQKGLRLQFQVSSPELAALPWEYLFDRHRGDYLSLSTSTPLVRYIPLPQPQEPLVITPPLRILGVVASPTGLPPINVENEKGRFEEAVAPLVQRGLIEVAWLPGPDTSRPATGPPYPTLACLPLHRSWWLRSRAVRGDRRLRRRHRCTGLRARHRPRASAGGPWPTAACGSQLMRHRQGQRGRRLLEHRGEARAPRHARGGRHAIRGHGPCGDRVQPLLLRGDRGRHARRRGGIGGTQEHRGDPQEVARVGHAGALHACAGRCPVQDPGRATEAAPSAAAAQATAAGAETRAAGAQTRATAAQTRAAAAET